MAGSSKKSYKGAKQYAVYAMENRYARNYVKKLTKHMKKHPEDITAKAALDNAAGGAREHKRKKPRNKLWHDKDAKQFAMMKRVMKGVAKAAEYGKKKVALEEKEKVDESIPTLKLLQ